MQDTATDMQHCKRDQSGTASTLAPHLFHNALQLWIVLIFMMLPAPPPTTSKLHNASTVSKSLRESAAIGRSQDVEIIINTCYAEMTCMPCHDIQIMVWVCCSALAQAHQLERAHCMTS